MQIQSLTLAASDLPAMRRFYTAVLGLRDMAQTEEARLTYQVGRSLLSFEPAPPGWTGRYHFALDVPPDRFEAALRWLHARGGPIAAPDGQTRFTSEGWNAEMVYFADPQGNILELIARLGRGSDRRPPAPQRDPERPFEAVEIAGITEIGLCADTVTGAVAELQSRIPGLPIYDGAGSDQFTPVGDENGLLIVVRRGRIWYPNTGVTAEPLPLEVLIESQAGGRYLLAAPPYPFVVSPVQ